MIIKNSAGVARAARHTCSNCGCKMDGAKAFRSWDFKAAHPNSQQEPMISAVAHATWQECSAALAADNDEWGETKGCTYCYGLHHDVSTCPRLVTVDG